MLTAASKAYTIEIKCLLDAKTRNALSPNGRPHFMARSRAAKEVRDEAYVATRLAKGWWRPMPGVKVGLSVDAAYDKAGLTDADNFWGGCMKPVRDGIMDCLAPDTIAARRDANVEMGELRLRSARKAPYFRVQIEVLE